MSLARRVCLPVLFVLLVGCGKKEETPSAKTKEATPGKEQTPEPPDTKQTNPPKKQPSGDAILDLLSKDVTSVGFAELGPHWDGPEKESVARVSSAHPIVMTWEARNLEKTLGLPAAKIHRIWMITGPPGVLGVTAREPVDRKAILDRYLPDGAEKTVQGKTYHANPQGEAVYFANERSFVLGKPDDIEALLSAMSAGQGKLPASALAHAFYFDVRADYLRKLAPAANDKSKPFLPLFKANSLQVTADVQPDGLQIRVRAEFADEAAAKAAAPALESSLKWVDWYMGQLNTSMPEFAQREQAKFKGINALVARMKEAYDATQQALGKATTVQKGSVLEATVQIATKEPATTAILLVTALPRAKK